MAIWELFSKRAADLAKSGVEDVYQYTDIPQPLRVQISQIAIEALGMAASYGYTTSENPRWVEIENIFCREKGSYALGNARTSGDRVITYMSGCSTEDWIDLLELLCFSIIVVNQDNQHFFRQQWGVEVEQEAALDEVNYRLREAGVGYQFEEEQVIRVDSQFIHAEVVKPALSLLTGREFDGPRDEFLTAHQHYRRGEHRQAVAMAANSLESTFKSIFDKKGWEYQKGARISDLIKVARSHSLWPDYLDASFDQLVATLQSGLPKIRDNDASHGQGAVPKGVPAFVAAYALHLAASKIVFLVGAANA
ncbi:STM4504/CBY_0614 family protein [Sphingomonas sp. UNC305MFCol5.2]|uniref:STM4504/CBY_0614 family protein n=1 Tax=Sphingomonas sp. UNC305MFCol5.2 TaxID=1449076 RepID=UPI000429A58C|nr:hypothetical protein [Sphingomonas sp. UNC305MFCol5.2]